MSSEKVQAEIDKYIKTQTDLFEEIKKTSDPVSSPGQIDYVPPQAALTIAALNTNELAQKEFLNKYKEQYDFITNLRQKYVKESEEVNSILSEQTTELAELESEKKQYATGATTEFRKLKTEKYNQAKQDFYYDLYMVCIVTLVIVFCILLIGVFGYLPRGTVLIVFLLAVFGLLAYVSYYIFFSTRARDVIVFDRFRYPVDGAGLDVCPNPEENKKKSEENEKLDAKIAGILSDTAGQCPVQLVQDENKMPDLPTTTAAQ